MFTAADKLVLVAALEDRISVAVRAQRAARFPTMAPVYEAEISATRALIEKVRNVKDSTPGR